MSDKPSADDFLSDVEEPQKPSADAFLADDPPAWQPKGGFKTVGQIQSEQEQPAGTRKLSKDIGQGLGYFGNVARGITSDVAEIASGNNKYSAGENLAAAAMGEQRLPIDEQRELNKPTEEERKDQDSAFKSLRGNWEEHLAGISDSIARMLPAMAVSGGTSATAQALGLGSKAAEMGSAGLVFGFNEDGYDPKTGAVMALFPAVSEFGGKFAGSVFDKVLSKLGVESVTPVADKAIETLGGLVAAQTFMDATSADVYLDPNISKEEKVKHFINGLGVNLAMHIPQIPGVLGAGNEARIEKEIHQASREAGNEFMRQLEAGKEAAKEEQATAEPFDDFWNRITKDIPTEADLLRTNEKKAKSRLRGRQSNGLPRVEPQPLGTDEIKPGKSSETPNSSAVEPPSLSENLANIVASRLERNSRLLTEQPANPPETPDSSIPAHTKSAEVSSKLVAPEDIAESIGAKFDGVRPDTGVWQFTIDKKTFSAPADSTPEQVKAAADAILKPFKEGPQLTPEQAIALFSPANVESPLGEAIRRNEGSRLRARQNPPEVAKLRTNEKQGDLMVNQTEDFALVPQKGTDGERIAQAKAQAEQRAADVVKNNEVLNLDAPPVIPGWGKVFVHPDTTPDRHPPISLLQKIQVPALDGWTKKKLEWTGYSNPRVEGFAVHPEGIYAVSIYFDTPDKPYAELLTKRIDGGQKTWERARNAFDGTPEQVAAEAQRRTDYINKQKAKENVGVRKGEVGGMMSPGEVVLTSSGRKTTPFPKVKTDTNRKATAAVKAIDQWLMENALAEAEARGDEFNALSFRANKDKPQQADKDGAEEYLFGKQPEVLPKLLKPVTADSARENLINSLKRTGVLEMPNDDSVRLNASEHADGKFDVWHTTSDGVRTRVSDPLKPMSMADAQKFAVEFALNHEQPAATPVKPAVAPAKQAAANGSPVEAVQAGDIGKHSGKEAGAVDEPKSAEATNEHAVSLDESIPANLDTNPLLKASDDEKSGKIYPAYHTDFVGTEFSPALGWQLTSGFSPEGTHGKNFTKRLAAFENTEDGTVMVAGVYRQKIRDVLKFFVASKDKGVNLEFLLSQKNTAGEQLWIPVASMRVKEAVRGFAKTFDDIDAFRNEVEIPAQDAVRKAASDAEAVGSGMQAKGFGDNGEDIEFADVAGPDEKAGLGLDTLDQLLLEKMDHLENKATKLEMHDFRSAVEELFSDPDNQDVMRPHVADAFEKLMSGEGFASLSKQEQIVSVKNQIADTAYEKYISRSNDAKKGVPGVAGADIAGVGSGGTEAQGAQSGLSKPGADIPSSDIKADIGSTESGQRGDVEGSGQGRGADQSKPAEGKKVKSRLSGKEKYEKYEAERKKKAREAASERPPDTIDFLQGRLRLPTEKEWNTTDSKGKNPFNGLQSAFGWIGDGTYADFIRAFKIVGHRHPFYKIGHELRQIFADSPNALTPDDGVSSIAKRNNSEDTYTPDAMWNDLASAVMQRINPEKSEEEKLLDRRAKQQEELDAVIHENKGRFGKKTKVDNLRIGSTFHSRGTKYEVTDIGEDGFVKASDRTGNSNILLKRGDVFYPDKGAIEHPPGSVPHDDGNTPFGVITGWESVSSEVEGQPKRNEQVIKDYSADSESAPAVLSKIADSNISWNADWAALLLKNPLARKTKFRLSNNAELGPLAKANKVEAALGAYLGKEVLVNDIATDNPELFERIALHELFHAATVGELNDLKTARSKELASILSELHEITPEADRPYGLKNVRELVAELTNKEFRDFLKSKTLKSKQSAWGKIVDWIVKLFGVTPESKTAYDRVSKLVEEMIESPVGTEAVRGVDFSLAKSRTSYNKKRDFSETGNGEVHPGLEVAAGFGSLSKLKRQAADALGLKGGALRFLKLARQEDLAGMAFNDVALDTYYAARSYANTPAEKSFVSIAALDALTNEQALHLKIADEFRKQLALVTSRQFQDKTIELDQRTVSAELAAQTLLTFKNQIRFEAGKILREMQQSAKISGKVDQLSEDLRAVQNMTQYNHAVAQRVQWIVDVVAATEEGRAALTSSTKNDAHLISRIYFDISKAAKQDTQEKAFVNLAARVLVGNRDLTQKLVALKALRDDPHVLAAVSDFGKKFASMAKNDPGAALAKIAAAIESRTTKSIVAEQAWLALHKDVVSQVERFKDLKQAMAAIDVLKASPEYKQLVSDVHADAGAVRRPDVVVAKSDELGISKSNEFAPKQKLIAPNGMVFDIDYGVTKDSVRNTAAKLKRYLDAVSEWMDKPENADSPDRTYWQNQFNFSDAVLRSSNVINPAHNKPLAEFNLWIPEFIFEGFTTPAGKLAETAKSNYVRASVKNRAWVTEKSPIVMRALYAAAKEHGYDPKRGFQEYRRDILSPLAFAYRIGRALKAGDSLPNGVKLLASDIAAFRTQGQAFNELFSSIRNTGNEKVMAPDLVYDEFGDGAFVFRKPMELGAEAQTTLPQMFSDEAMRLSRRVNKTGGDLDALENLFNDEDVFRQFVTHFIGERHSDYSKLTDYEDLYAQLSDKIKAGASDAPKSIQDIVDYIYDNTPPSDGPPVNKNAIRSDVLGEMFGQLDRFYKNHAEKEIPEKKVQTVYRPSGFREGFKRYVGSSFFYDYGVANTPEMRSRAIDADNFHLERLANSLQALAQDLEASLDSYNSASPERQDAMREKNKKAYSAGETYQLYANTQKRLKDVRGLLNDWVPTLEGQRRLDIEMLTPFRRIMQQTVGNVLSGITTPIKVLIGSQVKEGAIMGGMQRYAAQAYAKAAISMTVSALRMVPAVGIGLPVQLAKNLPSAVREAAKAEGTLNKAATFVEHEFSRVTDDLFRFGTYWKRMKELGMTPDNPVGIKMANMLTMPDSRGEGYNSNYSPDNKFISKIKQFGWRAFTGYELSTELVKAHFPQLAYNVAYDSAARNSGWLIDVLATQAKHSFDVLQKTGKLADFNLDDPSDPKNTDLMTANLILPEGVFPKLQTELNQARNWFHVGTDVGLVENVIRYWKRLSEVEEGGRGDIHFLAPEERDAAAAAELARRRALSLEAKSLADVHHALPTNRPYILQANPVLQAMFPLVGWGLQTTRQVFSILGKAPRDPRFSNAVLWSGVALTFLAGVSASVLNGETEKKIIDLAKRWIFNQEGEHHAVTDARNTKQLLQILGSDATAYNFLANSLYNTLLGEQGVRSSNGIQIFPVEKINAWLNFFKGVLNTHDATYGLADLVKAEVPLSRILINKLDSQVGRVEQSNAKKIIAKHAPEEVADNMASRGGFGSTPTELTPFKVALANAIFKGEGVELAFKNLVTKAKEMGKEDPEKTGRQIFETLNPYRQAVGTTLTDAQRKEFLASLSSGEMAVITRAEQNYEAAAQQIGTSANLVKGAGNVATGSSGGGGSVAGPSGGSSGGGGSSSGGSGRSSVSYKSASGSRLRKARAPKMRKVRTRGSRLSSGGRSRSRTFSKAFRPSSSRLRRA